MRVVLTKRQIDAVNAAVEGLQEAGFRVTSPRYIVSPRNMKVIDAYGQLVTQLAEINIEVNLDITTTINCTWEGGEDERTG